jgi:hypothetical protein
MSTKRQTILNNIKTIITGITSGGSTLFKHVNITRIPPTELDTTPFPAAFIYSDREVKFFDGENAVIGSETWDWSIIIEVWAQDKDMEDILNSVHSAMFADYKFTNTAEWSERIGVELFTVDTSRSIEAMLIPFRVIYRHILGNMEA